MGSSVLRGEAIQLPFDANLKPMFSYCTWTSDSITPGCSDPTTPGPQTPQLDPQTSSHLDLRSHTWTSDLTTPDSSDPTALGPQTSSHLGPQTSSHLDLRSHTWTSDLTPGPSDHQHRPTSPPTSEGVWAEPEDPQVPAALPCPTHSA